MANYRYNGSTWVGRSSPPTTFLGQMNVDRARGHQIRTVYNRCGLRYTNHCSILRRIEGKEKTRCSRPHPFTGTILSMIFLQGQVEVHQDFDASRLCLEEFFS